MANNEDDLSFESDEHFPTTNGAGTTGSISVAMSEDNDFEDINEKLRQIEQEAEKIRAMQSEVEKQFQGSNNGSPGIAQSQMSVEDKMLIDGRSIYVGNVDYGATPDQLEEHFHGCGAIERVTILTDKFTGHPKGFAYIQFAEIEGMQNSLSLGDSLFLGRQIKVVPKRTNKPGISTTNRPPRGRGPSGRARVVIKYIYPGMRGRTRPTRKRGAFFSPY
ncbi:RRM domain-containing protein [Meloidogyne graminicola]|uniref:RRM domain-containing protein n=1 Tax=Meloidogyne graminicola TaxID=189291 RepID=A0A8S9ZY10_9BILA|nr:RRM domain-containing protein [Meloidogyne graminicola]